MKRQAKDETTRQGSFEWEQLPRIEEDGNVYDAKHMLLHKCASMPFHSDIKAMIAADVLKTLVISRVARLKQGEPVPRSMMIVPSEPAEFVDSLAPAAPVFFCNEQPCFANVLIFSKICPTKDVEALVVAAPSAVNRALADVVDNLDPYETATATSRREIRHADILMNIVRKCGQ